MALDELIFGSEKIENVTIFKFQGSINSFTSQRFLESLKKPIRHGAIISRLGRCELDHFARNFSFERIS
jgi:hypothetical protein